MRQVKRRWVLPAVLSGAVLLGAPVPEARADEAQPAAEAEAGAPTSVRIVVQIINASAAPGEVDARLLRVQKRLSDFKFASFRLLSEKSLTLGLKSQETMALPGNRSLEITPRRFEKGGKLRVHLHLKSDKNLKLIDTDYAIEPGGDLLVGGPKMDDGTLVVFIHHGS